jgi:hypothetical protein
MQILNKHASNLLAVLDSLAVTTKYAIFQMFCVPFIAQISSWWCHQIPSPVASKPPDSFSATTMCAPSFSQSHNQFLPCVVNQITSMVNSIFAETAMFLLCSWFFHFNVHVLLGRRGGNDS